MTSRFKKFKAIGVAALLAMTLILAPQGAGAAMKFISFGTGDPGGTYYFIGAGFAAMINKYVDGVRVTAETTAASTENARLLIRNKLEMGLVCMGTFDDLKKEGMDVSTVKLMAVGHTSDTHWIVRKNSPIKSISDFKGKAIGVGPAGSATLNLYSKKHLTTGWGLTFNDFSPKYLSFSEITRGIRDNTIDAGLIAAGAPLASVMELARDVPIRLLDTEPAVLAKLRKTYSNIVPLVIPKTSYHGMEKDCHTYTLPQMLICRADLPEDVVYKIMKAIYDHQREKNAIHPLAAMYTLEYAFRGADKGDPIDFHPGAIKYFQEKGFWDNRAKYF
jgi:TRAP transporter TAXI family solute receptor